MVPRQVSVPRLDPRSSPHLSLLAESDDAERQMVNHVAEEVRGLMDYAVADQSPAGEDAIAGWVQDRVGDRPRSFEFGQKRLTSEQTMALAKGGLKNQNVLGRNEFEFLSTGFADGDVQELDEGVALDHYLAQLFSTRRSHELVARTVVVRTRRSR